MAFVNADQDFELTLPASRRTFEIVSIVGYLIGVKQEKFGQNQLRQDVYDRLQEHKSARTIRCLCAIRTALLKYYDTISYGLEHEYKNLDKRPEYIDNDDLVFLQSIGIQFIVPNCRIDTYIANANRYISQHISGCRDVIPLWLEWAYIKNLISMPNGSKESGIRTARKAYTDNIKTYPYSAYINWPLPENGNILHNDAKFAQLLYQANRSVFKEYDKVVDAGSGTKNGLADFLVQNENVALIVDCENSDPYKLCAVLRNLANSNPTGASHIRKIMLFDDVHTATTWQILSKFIEYPVEHILIHRVHGKKSLVDIRMTAGACKEFYENQTNAFIIVSSDSDYWGLITALPEAKFLVMVEYEKYGQDLREALEGARIFYCFMDNFARGGINDIKEAALLSAIKPQLDNCVHLNINTMLSEAYKATRIDMSTSERQNFVTKYIQKLRVQVDAEGDVSLVI